MSTSLPEVERMAHRRRWYRVFRAITICTVLSLALVGGIVAGLFASVTHALPDDTALADIRPPAPTRVLAIDGSVLARFYRENREIIPIERMNPQLINATLAIEDIRFFSHPGIDVRGIGRAMVKNISAGNTKEGASTITQQLARNLYLTRRQEIGRKLQEMVLALEMERRYSKAEILEAYLNQVYYGTNKYGLQSYGVQIASRNFFGKTAEQLTIAEAALLAGLPKNPRDYSPYRYPKAARERRNTVLASMRANRFVSEEQYRQALDEPVKLMPEKPLEITADAPAPYFVRHIVTVEIPKIFGQDANDLMYRYGIDIHTSLDARMQKVAEQTVATQVQKNKFRKIDDGALVSIDPKTGYIKAMVGGTNYKVDQFDIVTQGHRQPGSSFKPFVYTAAMVHGYTQNTIVQDAPRSYQTGTGQMWSPKNSDGSYLGALPMKKALWLSRNCAAAGVAADVGIERIIKIAHAMGIKYKLEPYLSTSLGASVVVPMEICSAYGTLANHGVHNEPTGVIRVTAASSTQVLYQHHLNPRRAIPSEIADNMKTMMRGVLESGTGQAARCPFPASGKTGTTNSYKDAWFIGYTDDLVTAVWVGNRSNEPMNRTFGGTVPAPIWKQFMLVAQPLMAASHAKHAEVLARANAVPELSEFDTTPTPYIAKMRGLRYDTSDQDAAAEADPDAVAKYTRMICTETGDLATPWCPETMMVTYVRGEEPAPPVETCKHHTGPRDIPTIGGVEGDDDSGKGVAISICAETAKIATDTCPIVLQRRFLSNAPTETCPLHGRR